MKNIGIIGRGFVGNAVANGFSEGTGFKAKIRVFDTNPLKSTHSLEEVIKDSEVVFISVPTPSNKNGSINLDTLDNCLEQINKEAKKIKKVNCIFLIRSTIVPGTTRRFQNKFPNLKLVFNPEFLTERSATFDFISQTRYVLGGEKKNTKTIKELYQLRFGSTISIIETDYESAELIKYVCNTFFATKVSFLNEMKLLSDKVGADWDTVIEGFVRDGRVGHSHTQVPGPDGKLGFGGSCFPKDIQALINFGDSLSINLNVLKGAWKTNLKMRPEKDWEKLLGRAIVNENKTK